MPPLRLRRLLPAFLAAVLLASGPAADAQPIVRSGARPVRAYVSPDELVSFLPTTPFSEFVALVNPIFLRVTGKRLVDPMDRRDPIGISLNGVHFIDAFELVLDRSGLDFRETEHYFIISEPTPPTSSEIAPGEAREVPAGVVGPGADDPMAGLPATAESREVRIDAIIFEANNSRIREVGTNWPTLFGEAASAGGGTGGGGGGGGGGTGQQGPGAPPRFFLNGESFFDAISDFVTVTNDQVDFAVLMRLFRFLETRGLGQTIASPSVTVQSGEQGRMQSGSDIPINIQDFQGNTITQFISTGIIIDVTPTLISDASAAGEDGEPVEFVHLDVKVEKSTGRPSSAGIQIDKNDVNTQVLLLDGEQTVIGGLYSTEEGVSRRGIPVLMNIPLLKYLFSYTQRTVARKELVVVLRASVLDPIPTRAARPLPENIYQEEHRRLRERLDRFRTGEGREYEMAVPDRDEPGDDDAETDAETDRDAYRLPGSSPE
ncbi:MAG TPA: type II and III secretion system protein [Rubricoccaceae bacterium]|nr:type II and III secretion system protein [Rubricoccaceae bacterium]